MRFDQLTYDEVIARDLQVMDTAAFALCRDSDVPLRIFDMAAARQPDAHPARRARRHAGDRAGTRAADRAFHSPQLRSTIATGSAAQLPFG